MPLRELSIMSQRSEFVGLARREGGEGVRALCRRFGISPTTGYKWVRRHAEAGPAGLMDRPRRPHRSPGRTPAALEEAVLALRTAHPAWGGRKLRRRLLDRGHAGVPSASTITAILRRHDRLDPAESDRRRAPRRFERAAPNDLWQMDFKGHFAHEAGGRCHPLSLVDDHSRFLLRLEACADEREATVRAVLVRVFRRYGLPRELLMDRGPPWGPASAVPRPFTAFTAWLIRLGVAPGHGRPHHPQTQGKAERFHRSLTVEVIAGRRFADLAACQARFERWRRIYNEERPHEALGLAVPLSRYSPSPRPYPERLPPIEYAPDDAVRRVGDKGEISFRGRLLRVGKAFRGEPVALRPTAADGVFDVYFCHAGIGRIDLAALPPPRGRGTTGGRSATPAPPPSDDVAAGSGLVHHA